MNSKPILFSGEMVNAIIEGRKTQTRRVMKKQPDCKGVLDYLPPNGNLYYFWPHDHGDKLYYCKCPYATFLWVRETWDFRPWWSDGGEKMRKVRVSYAADGYQQTLECPPDWNPMLYSEQRWRPSIHMPRWASRITLKVVNVRAERVQDISREDILAEGINAHFAPRRKDPLPTPRSAFAQLWDTINKNRGYGWDVNPWVWVLEFERVRTQ